MSRKHLHESRGIQAFLRLERAVTQDECAIPRDPTLTAPVIVYTLTACFR